ncbi:MAG: hypothetical protein V7739_13925 [Motiliproteus sp.]
MNRDSYLAEVKKKLEQIFSASRDSYKIPPVQRHRLEGFMQAGVFLGLASNKELSDMMEDIHLRIHGKSIQERKDEKPSLWQEQSIDYSEYEQPTYERKKR